MTETNFTFEERNKIIAKVLDLRIVVDQLANDLDEAPDDDKLQAHLMQEYDKALNELRDAENEYAQGLPRIVLSRCPFSDETYRLSIDNYGLGGPWWDAQRPIRTFEEESQTFFALTGSVNVVGKIPDIPFIVKPGPAVPCVSPRLLEVDDIMGVLSHIKIGLYDAYIIVYYSKDKTYEIERINTWGTDEYLAEDVEGVAVLGSTYDDEDEYDFDIASWIKNGKLKWIAPNDDMLELHDSLDNCPYLNITGYQYPVLIQNKTIENCMIKLEYEEDEEHEEKEEEQEKEENVKPKFCPNCGTPVISEALFCANCGNKLN